MLYYIIKQNIVYNPKPLMCITIKFGIVTVCARNQSDGQVNIIKISSCLRRHFGWLVATPS